MFIPKFHYSPRAFLFIIWTLSIGHGFAQNKVINLKDVLKLAETNYPLAKAKAHLRQAAANDVQSTKMEYLPAFNLHEQMDVASTNALQGTYFTMGIVPSVSAPITSQNNYNPIYGSVSLAGIEWDAVTFGKRNAKLDMAKASYAAAEADEQVNVLQYQTAAVEAYLNLLVLIRINRLQQVNVDRTALLLNVARSGAMSGLKSGVDSALANAEASKARLLFNESIKNRDIQQILLAQLLGLDSTNFLVDTAALSILSNLEIPNEAAKAEDHPLAKYYQSKVSLADATARYTERSYLPDLKLLGYGWGRGSGILPSGERTGDFGEGVELDHYNYAAAISLTFNILDYPRVRAAYNANRERQSAIEEEYHEGLMQVRNEQNIATVQINQALQQLKETPLQLTASLTAYNQMQARYNSGLTTLTELMQALYGLNRAEVDVVFAESDYWKAMLYKAGANGDINYFIQNLK